MTDLHDAAFPPIHIASSGVQIAWAKETGVVRLQVFHRSPRAVEELSAGLGFDLPGSGQIFAQDGFSVACSAPGEWLVFLPQGTEAAFIARCPVSKEGMVVAANCITDAMAVLQLEGADLENVLARASTVDFSRRTFGPGLCAGTRFAGVLAMIAWLPGQDNLDLLLDRSLADYVIRWLAAAAIKVCAK